MVVAIGAAASCEKKKDRALHFPHMELLLSYPATGATTDFATTCAGAESMLVSFDVDGDRAWEYRFLFGTDGTLWGCDGAPCDEPIDGELPDPRRVMAEGITVAPDRYGTRRHDVACRGIADPAVGMGVLVSSPVLFPGVEDDVHAEIPMLRVGGFNGMFDATGPFAPGMAASLLVPENRREDVLGTLQVATGGIVVAAGGYDVTNANRPFLDVWEFEPWEIAWTRTATLSTGHVHAAAEPFVDAAGEAGVLFVGGLGTNLRAVTQSDAYRRGEAVTEPFAMSGARFFPGVVRVTDRDDPVIAVLGGCPTTLTYFRDYEFFYPEGQPAGCPSPGQPGFCTPPSPSPTVVMNEGRCEAATALLPDGRIYFATGRTDDNELSSVVYVFDASDLGDYGDYVGLLQSAVRLPATVPLVGNRIGLFGGITTPPPNFPSTDRWFTIDPLTGEVATGLMRERRGFHTATPLLDDRILVVGGIDELAPGAYLRSAEIFERGSEEAGGTFEYIPPAGRSTCVPGVECEQMSVVRYAHAAVRIAGSATWLEGAVVIAGGSVVPGGASELFVPAYHCDGHRPVNRLDGRRVPDVEHCDRLRDPLGLTDPRDPTRF